MSGDTGTVIISGVVSLASAFGSILLKDHLDVRREQRKAAAVPSAVPVQAAEPTAAPPSPAKPASSTWDADVAPAAAPATARSPGTDLGSAPSFSRVSPVAAPAPAGFAAGARQSAPAPLPEPRPVLRSTKRRASAIRAAATVVVGFTLGSIITNLGVALQMATLLVMIAATAALLVYFVRPRNRSLIGYLLGTISLWAAFVGGISFDTGSVSEANVNDFYRLSVVFTALGLIAFGVTFRWGRRARS